MVFEWVAPWAETPPTKAFPKGAEFHKFAENVGEVVKYLTRRIAGYLMETQQTRVHRLRAVVGEQITVAADLPADEEHFHARLAALHAAYAAVEEIERVPGLDPGTVLLVNHGRKMLGSPAVTDTPVTELRRMVATWSAYTSDGADRSPKR